MAPSSLTRARSPAALKRYIAPYVLDPAAHLAEPMRFDADFEGIASVSSLRFKLLSRPV